MIQQIHAPVDSGDQLQKHETKKPAIDLATLLAQLGAPGPTVSPRLGAGTSVLDAEYMRSRAFVQVVRVILEPGEQYQTGRSYRGRKRVMQQKVVYSGIDKPWDVIKSCHEFGVPMQTEQECLEILWFIEGDHHDRVQTMWEQGQALLIMAAYPFLLKKDWNISRTPLRLGDGDHIEIRLQPMVLQEEPRNNTRHRHLPAPRPARRS